METWSAHQLYTRAVETLGQDDANQLQRYAQGLIARKLPVIFTLRHLAQICDVRYWMLHETVDRMREASNYRMYAVKKRSGGRRFIHAVASDLLKVQKFVNEAILQRCQPHSASYAFHPSGGIRECAAAHCGARWLFQFDLTDFFYDVSEVDVYRSFEGLGYRPLLAFELARICTTTRMPKWRPRAFYRRYPYDDLYWEYPRLSRPVPYYERWGYMGALPQGAPSSPMLANLAARQLDEGLNQFANKNGFVYTRYADDITVSATHLPMSRGRVRANVIRIIRNSGFRENEKKCRIAGPGSKKTVLGLLVDGPRPRISREMYKRIDHLLYGADKNGFESAAAYNRFDSAYGFHNHICGMIAFIKSVDEQRWEEFSRKLTAVKEKWGWAF